MITLIQPITVQQAYEGIAHTRWWASWNWWWRRVGDDLWSPKQTPYLPSRWRTGGGGGSISWNMMKLLLLFFSPIIWIYSTKIRVSGASWAPQATRACPGGGRALVPRGQQVAPLQWVFALVFFICSIKELQKVLSNSKNFYFCTKTTP